jgi:hypothetical protein
MTAELSVPSILSPLSGQPNRICQPLEDQLEAWVSDRVRSATTYSNPGPFEIILAQEGSA